MVKLRSVMKSRACCLLRFDHGREEEEDNHLFLCLSSTVISLISCSMVFISGDNCCGFRSDSQGMIPDGWVDDRIITMMAMCMTWFHTYFKIASNTSLLNLLDGSRYVPIEDHENHHWYLMVIHIEERKIYHLDTHLLDSTMATKHAKIHCVAETLSQLALSIYASSDGGSF
ncbi:hypothetical protein P8452_18773 [Trifolium repens]|nr:hypothetical protein P8452_18773 [Trifolium repens]